MSAFLVEKHTIDRIVSLICHESRRSEYFEKELGRELKVDFSDLNWRSQLGQKMWDINQLALGYRYGDEEVSLRYFYSDVSLLLSRVQLFKSLKCWLYQCAEGDIPEKSKLYKVFKEKIVPYIAVAIIEDMPEYEEAEWA